MTMRTDKVAELLKRVDEIRKQRDDHPSNDPEKTKALMSERTRLMDKIDEMNGRIDEIDEILERGTEQFEGELADVTSELRRVILLSDDDYYEEVNSEQSEDTDND